MPPEVTYSTRLYLFPIGVKGVVVSTSVTESMMSVEPTHTNVAMTASPCRGLPPSNPLMITVPLWLNAPFTECATTSSRGPPRLRFSGPADSLHPRATVSNPETPTIIALLRINFPLAQEILKASSARSGPDVRVGTQALCHGNAEGLLRLVRNGLWRSCNSGANCGGELTHAASDPLIDLLEHVAALIEGITD